MATFNKNIENQRQPAFAMDNPELFGEHTTLTLFKKRRGAAEVANPKASVW